MEELYMYNVVTHIQTRRLYTIVIHFTNTLNGKCNFFKTAIMLQYKEWPVLWLLYSFNLPLFERIFLNIMNQEDLTPEWIISKRMFDDSVLHSILIVNINFIYFNLCIGNIILLYLPDNNRVSNVMSLMFNYPYLDIFVKTNTYDTFSVV